MIRWLIGIVAALGLASAATAQSPQPPLRDQAVAGDPDPAPELGGPPEADRGEDECRRLTAEEPGPEAEGQQQDAGPALDPLPGTGPGDQGGQLLVPHRTASHTAARPCPPPMHIVSRA